MLDHRLINRPRGAVDLLTVLLVLGIIGIGIVVYLGRSSGPSSHGPAGSIQWNSDYDAAVQAAKTANKPLLLDFSASWCPPCKVMKEEVWPDPAISRLANTKYVPVYIDVDEQPTVASKFGVDGIPTVIILDKDGQPLFRQSGLISAPDLVRILNDNAK